MISAVKNKGTNVSKGIVDSLFKLDQYFAVARIIQDEIIVCLASPYGNSEPQAG